jgi:hypothetical protein
MISNVFGMRSEFLGPILILVGSFARASSPGMLPRVRAEVASQRPGSVDDQRSGDEVSGREAT